MAQKEIYRLDIKIGVNGDNKAKKKLTSTERFARQSEKRMKALDRVRASPSVKLKDRLSRPLSKVESKLNRFSKFAVRKLAAVATAGAVLVGGFGIASSVKTFANFEQGMKNVQATSQATQQEFNQLWDTAKRLGSTTAFSAKEASDGMNYLAMAGFKTNQIIEAMPGLLDLAAASSTDLATTSDIVSDAITAFGLKAKDTTHLADVMAKASSTANTNVEMLGQAYKYTAAPAHAFGMSAEEVTAALSKMADAGVKGTMGGTALRGALTRLAKPPKIAAKWLNRLGVSIADSHGKIKPFNSIMGDMRKKMSNLTQQQKQQAVASIFGQEAMSGMLAILNTSTQDFDKYTKSLKNADGAAKEMSKTKLDSLSGQVTILKSAVEGMQIELGERLAPYAKEFVTWFTGKIPDITNGIMNIVDKISNLAHKFNELSPATKKFIGYLATGIVLFNPLSKGINAVTKGTKGLIGLGAKLGRFFGIFKGASAVANATTAVAAGTEAAAGSIGGLGLAAKASAVLLNPWTWGIGAATVAGIKLYKYLKKDSIPAVKLFGEETSKATKQAVGAYMKLDNDVRKKLMSFRFSNSKISKETSAEVVKNFNDMGIQIKGGIDKHFGEAYNTIKKFFTNSKVLSDNEETEILTKMKKSNETKKAEIDKYTKEINTILDRISKGKVTDLEQAYARIDELQGKMRDGAVKHLSETEVQSKVILERMKSQHGTITAEQAAEVVRNSYAQKTQAIKDAEEQYNSRVAWVIRERDEYGTITEEQASKLIEEAGRQKTEAINKASEMHSTVVEHARQQAGEHASHVNWETGQVLSNFDSMMAKIREFNALSIKEKVVKIVRKVDSIFKKKNDSGMGTYRGPGSIYKLNPGFATGTNNAMHGVHEVAERGFEIVVGRQTRMFRGGERVLNNKESKKLLGFNKKKINAIQEKPRLQFPIAQPQLAMSGGENTNINVDVNNEFNNETDVDKIVAEAAKQFAHKLKQSLKNIKK